TTETCYRVAYAPVIGKNLDYTIKDLVNLLCKYRKLLNALRPICARSPAFLRPIGVLRRDARPAFPCARRRLSPAQLGQTGPASMPPPEACVRRHGLAFSVKPLAASPRGVSCGRRGADRMSAVATQRDTGFTG